MKRHNPSPSMIVALLALFVALSGVTWAASTLKPAKNSVKSKHIKDGQVKSADVANNAITGTDVNESTLDLPGAPSSLPPSGPAGGALSGSYPNPGIAASAVGTAEIDTLPSARVTRTTAFSVPNNSASEMIPFTTESFDTADMHDNTTDNSLLTAPVTGTYVVSAHVRWAPNTSGARYVAIDPVGGSPDPVSASWVPATGGEYDITDQNVTAIIRLQAGESVALKAHQDSGGPLDIEAAPAPSFSMAWVGP